MHFNLLALCRATTKQWNRVGAEAIYHFDRIDGNVIYYSKHRGKQNDDIVVEIIPGKV